ncbi:hypothetical protein ABQF26_02375 [Mycolicibacterium elephantis]
MTELGFLVEELAGRTQAFDRPLGVEEVDPCVRRVIPLQEVGAEVNARRVKAIAELVKENARSSLVASFSNEYS